MKKAHKQEPQVLLYQTDDGTTRVEVRIADETVWLNQNQMADLFLTTKQNVGQHIRNVFAEGELPHESATSHEHGVYHRWVGTSNSAREYGP